MRVLITGGAGFIGSHLAEAYLRRGDEVYILDDLSTGTMENIRHLQEHETYKERFFVTVDSVLHYDKTLKLVGMCDTVVHLAAAVGVQYILDNPLTSIMTNVHGAETILELCSKFKKKVLIASTSEVYGKQHHGPLKETDYCVYGPSTKSRWSYAASKLIDEFTALAYYRTKKLPVIIVRLFNTVGPRQTWRYGMVIPRFVKQALEHQPITVYGRAIQFSNSIPMRARACAGWAASRRQAAAMLVWPAHLNSPMAVLRNAAIMWGILPQRTCERSSSNVTSRTQWDLFSIPQ